MTTSSPKTAGPKSNIPVVRVPPAEKAASDKQDAASRKRIRSYYEKKYDAEVDRLRALRLSTRRRKLGLLIAGGLLLAASLAAWVATRLEVVSFQSLEVYEVAVAAAAILALITAALLKPVEDLPDTRLVEHEVDEARYRDINVLMTKTGKLIKGVGEGEGQETFNLRLEGYPEKSEIEGRGLLVVGRIGIDGQPRFTPVKVTGLRLFEQSLAIYQVTVDLATGSLVTERLLELAYRDIITLERSSQTVAVSPEREGGKLMASMRRAKPGQALRDKDMLSIHFASQQSINIVLRDSAFADFTKAANLPLSSSHESIERFWLELRERWLGATGRSRA